MADMKTASEFRVISRGKAALIALPVLIVAAVIVSVSVDSIESYVSGLADLKDAEANEAIRGLTAMMKVLAISQLIFLLLCSGYIIWYARRAIETESLPPAGSWIVAGQRIRSGGQAVLTAKIMIGLAVFLPICGALLAVYMWRLALLFPELAGAA